MSDVIWNGAQVETGEQRLDDPGTGKPIILRRFEFSYNPAIKYRPTKKDILTKDYLRFLDNRLWADELELIAEPRVVFGDTSFSVFVTCQAKKGSRIPDYAQDQLKPLQNKLAKV